MKRFAKLLTVLVGAMTVAEACSAGHAAGMGDAGRPTFAEKLDRHVEHFDTAGRPLIAVLIDLAYEYELPMGIEYLDRESLTVPIDLRLQDESVRAILIATIQQVPEYQVAFSGGLVDVFVPRERENTSSLLNKVIKDFNVAEQDTGVANFELACALGSQANPSSVCVGSIAKGQLGTTRASLHLQNAKVYEILNAMVAQNGKAIWTVIVSRSSLTDPHSSDLWHIYPIQPPFKEIVLDKLRSIPTAEGKAEQRP
jgi:hypothetical protein